MFVCSRTFVCSTMPICTTHIVIDLNIFYLPKSKTGLGAAKMRQCSLHTLQSNNTITHAYKHLYMQPYTYDKQDKMQQANLRGHFKRYIYEICCVVIAQQFSLLWPLVTEKSGLWPDCILECIDSSEYLSASRCGVKKIYEYMFCFWITILQAQIVQEVTTKFYLIQRTLSRTPILYIHITKEF